MNIKVKDVMHTGAIKKVMRSTTLRELLMMFKSFHTDPLIPVVNGNDALIGIVYPENLLDILRPQHSKLFRNIPFVEVDKDSFDLEPSPLIGQLIIVDDIMDLHFISIGADETADKAYKLIRMHKKDRLAVVDSNRKFVGIVGIFDIIWRMFKEKGIVE
ncbi:MAG: CBS domain-containing protein [Candidatus Omnitrophota bacterium]